MTDVQNGVPVTSNTVSPEYKSVVPSVFFGFFAAPSQAHNAKKNGLKGNRYWAAAAISTFAGIALMIVLAVVVGFAASKAINAQNPKINPGIGISQPGDKAVGPVGTVAFTPEHLTDTSQKMLENIFSYMQAITCYSHGEVIDEKFVPVDNDLNSRFHKLVTSGGEVCQAHNVSGLEMTEQSYPDPSTGNQVPVRILTWTDNVENNGSFRESENWRMVLTFRDNKWQELHTTIKVLPN